MSVIDESEALHRRVLAFAEAGARPAAARTPEDFDALALSIAEFQARHVPGFRRLLDARGGSLDSVDRIPAVPVDAFRLTRVAVHPPELDAARFATSGTTGQAAGVHAFRTTATYRALALLAGRAALLPGATGGAVVVALAPRPEDAPGSSLGFMMRAFMEAFDGRPLERAGEFEAESRGRWLAEAAGVDLDGVRRAADAAQRRGEPLLVLATAFALVLLLDSLAGGRIDAPHLSVVMPTGGTKGRTRDIEPAELRRQAALAFGLAEDRVVGEYGMTELSSQLYERCLPGASNPAPPGVFVPPPWLRVVPVEPTTLEPVREGEVGLARFVDLGNVDSAVAVVTQDRIRREGPGVVLEGRLPGAPPRGCSLAIEEMVLGGRPG